MVKVKSVYSRASEEDGQRVLVDLFWPEGIKTREAHVHEWLSGLGPSYDLQRFHWDTADWQSYKSKYAEEVLADKSKRGLLEQVAEKSKSDTVTLLYGNKDPQHNHAVLLKELIEDHVSDQ